LNNILQSLTSLNDLTFFMEATTDLSARTRVLGFDLQTLIQIGIQAVAILLLFYFLGRLVFNPVREILIKRKEDIEASFDKIERGKTEVNALKDDYENRIKNIKAEADKILSHAHTKAIAREDEIVKEAHEEANRIMQRAHVEIEREHEQMKDDIRKEIIEVATLMASKFIEASLDEEQQRVLINEALSEMGDDTWKS